MMRREFWIACLAGTLAAGSAVRTAVADSILDDAIPKKWFKQYIPEKLPDLDLPDYVKGDPLDLAEAQSFAGRYKLSLITVKKATNADPARVAILRAKSLWALGRSDEALAALTDEKVAADPVAQILTARILAATDKAGAAIALLKTHLQGHPDSIPAHYYLGMFSEAVGDLNTAREQYTWFVTPPHNYLNLWLGSGDRAFDSAEDVTTIARALDRWAVLESKYKDDIQLNNTILNMFVKAYDVIDRSYWPAHVAAAQFYIAHDDPDKAFEELQLANAANPRSAEIDRLMGELMLDHNKYDFVEQMISSLRDVQDDSIDADLLEGRLDLFTGQREAGAVLIQHVLAKHPDHLEALGLLAGYEQSRARPADAAAYLKQADTAVPNQAVAYEEAAQLLEMLHQTKPAIELLKTAIDRTPWSSHPRNLLGTLYLHSGEDDDARATLEAAYALEPYNASTVNYLRLLDNGLKFHRTETDHFIFVYAPEDDIVVPAYFAPYMENAYRGLCDEFKYEPPQKTIIQIYPDSQSFSVRISGMPGIETFAVTYGRLIVAAAPRAGENIGAFNWGRVLKHEFAHVLHITETEGRVPRWLTEGLAVLSEKVDYRFEWVPPVFYKYATERKLFKVAVLNEIFQRPKGGADGEMAYMTGFWMSRYLIATYGDDSINKLLLAYKDGKNDNDAFIAATGQPLASVESAFSDWAAKEVLPWGYDQDTIAKYTTAFEHGENLVKQGKLDDAFAAFGEASKLQPQNPTPHRRMAGVALKLKHYNDALANLEWLIPLELSDNRYAKRIAGIYRDSGNLDKAMSYAQTAVIIDPYDPAAHDLVGALFTQSNQPDKAADEARVAQTLRDRKEKSQKNELTPAKAD